jgi:hypothetical protein
MRWSDYHKARKSMRKAVIYLAEGKFAGFHSMKYRAAYYYWKCGYEIVDAPISHAGKWHLDMNRETIPVKTWKLIRISNQSR